MKLSLEEMQEKYKLWKEAQKNVEESLKEKGMLQSIKCVKKLHINVGYIAIITNRKMP